MLCHRSEQYFQTKTARKCELVEFDTFSLPLYAEGTREYMVKRAFRKDLQVGSFEQLARQYEPMIHKIINTLHLYKNKEEYYQHGLIALWEASKRFDPAKGKFASYAYTYIRGSLLMELKKSIQEAEKYICPKEEFWESIKEPSLTESSTALDLLNDCQCLTANQRKWLYYTVNDGLTTKEIAKRENVSLSAVKNWRAGARAKLK